MEAPSWKAVDAKHADGSWTRGSSLATGCGRKSLQRKRKHAGAEKLRKTYSFIEVCCDVTFHSQQQEDSMHRHKSTRLSTTIVTRDVHMDSCQVIVDASERRIFVRQCCPLLFPNVRFGDHSFTCCSRKFTPYLVYYHTENRSHKHPHVWMLRLSNLKYNKKLRT